MLGVVIERFYCRMKIFWRIMRKYFGGYAWCIYLVMSLTAVFGLYSIYSKLALENRSLQCRLLEREYTANASRDRLRLIFYKYEPEFTSVAEYLTNIYGEAFYDIQYENGKISKKTDCMQDDEDKLRSFFALLQSEWISYSNDTDGIIYILSYGKAQNSIERKKYYLEGIYFTMYNRNKYSGSLRYGELPDINKEIDYNEYNLLQYTATELNEKWSSHSSI